MNPRYLLMSLVCLGWLFAAGCTPSVEPAPTVPATMPALAGTPTPTNRPITTPTPVATPLPDTLTPTFEAGASPVRPTLSLPEVRASQTALWADIYASIPTRTPTPTFTPIPGPVWPIVFSGVPCVPGHPYCTDEYRDGPMQWYQIYSDGSGFRPVDQLENPELVIQDILFSPDGTLMAYWAWSEQGYRLFLADLHNNNPQELAAVPSEQGHSMQGLNFMPGTNCLVVWWSDYHQAEEFETVSIERLCPGQVVPEVLGVFELPFRSRGYLLSPQGDAFLSVSRDRSDNLQLYIQELGIPTPPRLLFTLEDEEELVNISARRWHPDGQSVEFFLNSWSSLAYDSATVTSTRYVISRDGQAVETFPILENAPYGLCCEWSPDGREILSAFGGPSEVAGIHIFDLETTTWRQVLPGFYLDRGPIWSPEMP